MKLQSYGLSDIKNCVIKGTLVILIGIGNYTRFTTYQFGFMLK